MLRAKVAILVAVLAGEAQAADWPEFRGTKRDGASREQGLLGSWPAGGPREVWRRPLGDGYSAIAIAGERLYTMYAADNEGKPTEFAAAFEAETGKELWRRPLSERYDNEFGHGPRATPTVAGDSVYVLDSRGILAALATADGAERWRVSLLETFKLKQPYFGFSGSAVVDGDLLLLEAGGAEGKALVALDRASGAVRWNLGEGGGQPGYNSPVAMEVGGQRSFVWATDKIVRSLDRAGKELWSHPWPEGETHAVPVFVPPDGVFVSGVEGIGATLLRVETKPGGAVVTEAWKNPAMRNHFSGSVVHGAHLYGFDNATLKCIAIADGSLAWARRGFGTGSLIVVDGHLVVLSDTGALVLVAATAEGYVEQGRVQALEGRTWTAPALSGGRLYLRNHVEMVVYDLKG